MKIIHGTWIPQPESEFIQTGAFYVWVETDTLPKKHKKQASDRHPYQLTSEYLADFLRQEIGVKVSIFQRDDQTTATKYFLLPSANNKPLPSPELSRYLETEPLEATGWQSWAIDCCSIVNVIKFLNDLHFLCLHQADQMQLGSDLFFWYHYTQAFQQVILKDQYIPALKYHELPQPKGKRKKATPNWQIYPTWEIISEAYEADLQSYLDYMPLVCVAGRANGNHHNGAIAVYDKETLLRHFSEALLHNLVTNTPIPGTFAKKLGNSLLPGDCLNVRPKPWQGNNDYLETYQQWQVWRQKIVGWQNDATFHLCFQLKEAATEHTDDWQIRFLVSLKQDPSLRIELDDYWYLGTKPKREFLKQFGKDFERQLLLSLGYAARMYAKIWQGLETDKPSGFRLTLSEAFTFLSESAWVLEDAGFKVIVPAWWTPKGRQRAKIKLKAGAKQSAPSKTSKGYFQLDTIIQYQYELAIGDRSITEQEWQQLVNAKTPLVKFRGEWMQLDQSQMKQMLEFWQKHHDQSPEMSLLDLLQKAADADAGFEIDPDQTLAKMMAKLHDPSQIQPIGKLPKLQGTLREYQKRGVSWLQYLEQLGLNGCLADDMGLGKTVQVIARLVAERETSSKSKSKSKAKSKSQPAPTILIVPTSVIGNWHKEINKFAPHLRVLIHHGGDRLQDEADFQAACTKHDVVITSFTLARKDAKLFNTITWQRIVLDEAQNIKNPKAAQTKAILKMQAKHRLALTGTPVENRLLDLWSIFNFLNPGYLGREAQFRKGFEIPIQKENNQVQATTLKKLVQPLILRRVKTDKQIIKDLPDKLEHKQYCNLTKEQASLYEAVVKDVTEQLEAAEGIQRKGLILSTLTKLKQICNHPRQFLQDGSEFTAERSAKLQRLGEMLEEIFAEGESLLIFTQFTEIGTALIQHLKHTLHCNTYFLHGGTSRPKREQMIGEFQDPETEPSAFVLSLKAGGVGITLTKANHVFHFDRWWNPAVEDQATDRAFRIGQKKNVFVHKFVTIGTLEERIDQMIEDKKKMAGAIVGADESWLTELDNESFKQLITLSKQAVI
ncbi:SNF2-related protein (plasmid) [Thalassoporum mexicanum PCC 7367]|uniref:DEAD/DEAH box helicase n=1 Tax=Thalassoporum mexicanum TaxID=3457544 RepID=UPI00029F8D2B|nr:DEAD/DEAH box helicase [Pseudanabaena sp. PCC 7367]AFY72043.1 SNF2-related protein [Pseudanabaena sp. PCC 7367]